MMPAVMPRIWFPITNNHLTANNHSSNLDEAWFPITKNHQTDHSGNLDDASHDQQAGNSQPIIHQPAGESVSIDDPRSHSTYWSPVGSQTKTALVDGYTQLVTDRVRRGWSCHLVTIVFSKFPGPRSAVINRIRDEVQRVYSTLLTRVHRKPRAASNDDLPVLVGALDLPVYKRDRGSAPMVLCNAGLHFHALVLIPPGCRLRMSLADHFRDNSALYAGPGRSVQRIDVRPVVEDHGWVVDYVLKTVLNGRLSYDDAVMILPRSRGELETPSRFPAPAVA